MLINLFTLFSSVIISTVTVKGHQVPKSPCPDVLEYETETISFDRWYGVITLNSPEDVKGLWLKIVLDGRGLLRNWIASAVSYDYMEYSIDGSSYSLPAGVPVQVRFFVIYDTTSPNTVPAVKQILLNGKEICSTKTTGSTNLLIPVLIPPVPSKSLQSKYSTTMPVTVPKTTSSTNLLIPVLIPPVPSKSLQSKYSTTMPVTVPREPIQCGTIAQWANPMISHGQKTTPGQWPWHIAIYSFKGIDFIYTCGGTLISERLIVTAAHCVTKPKTNKHVDKENLVVYLGKYSLINFNNDVQTREVEQIIVHPGYNYTVFYNDIALVKLDTEAEFNNFVRPCCLWDDTDGNDIESLIGKEGTVVGWGFDENQRLSKTLMQAQMPILSTSTCLFSNRDFFAQFMFDKNFCAGFTNGTSVCNGDSGGGMVIKKFSARGLNVLWQLRGIVSVGVPLQGQGVCDTKQYTIFTDAGKYVQWIKEILQQT